MVINPLTGRFRLGMKPEHALKSERTGPLSPKRRERREGRFVRQLLQTEVPLLVHVNDVAVVIVE
jgi:hypothetical protein